MAFIDNGVDLTAENTDAGALDTTSPGSAASTSPRQGPMPTWVADYRTAKAPVAYEWTAGRMQTKEVSGAGNKVYIYLALNTGKTEKILLASGDKIAVSFMNQQGKTNNVYWGCASPSGGGLYGTVGGDIQIGPDGGFDLNQYIDVTNPYKTGFPHTLGDEICGSPPPSPIGNAKCYVDSNGQSRQSVYTVLGNPSYLFSYAIMGGLFILRANGQLEAVILIDAQSQMSIGVNSSVGCACPQVDFAAFTFDWFCRAPPPFISPRLPPNPPTPPQVKNYEAYQTVGGTYDNNGGTAALRLLQRISTTQIPGI